MAITATPRSVLSMAGLLFMALLPGCELGRPVHIAWCSGFDELALSEVAGDPPAVVLEDPGTIMVMHGSGRASRHKGDIIYVEQSAELPSYANRATVFLNGWRMSYQGTDHHVRHIGSMVSKIRFERGKLTWNALGFFTDEGREEAYNWEYHYTVIAWNDNRLAAMVDHNDADHFCETGGPDGADNFFMADNDGTDTALSCFPSFLRNPGFASGREVAVLPRGFGFRWGWSVRLFLGITADHHLLQLAYNLEGVEPFIADRGYYKAFDTVNPLPSPPTGRVGDGFVSWNSYAIFKDNKGRRDYSFAELVSGMGGADVGVIEPPFAVLPRGSVSGLFSGSGVTTQEVVIDNIPYAYAIPMLTGWDIGYGDDQHVKEIGVWIDDWRYDRPPGATTGTLRCSVSSIVKDKDDHPENFFDHKLTILGLRPLSGKPEQGPVIR